jgi:hypothetical protein
VQTLLVGSRTPHVCPCPTRTSNRYRATPFSTTRKFRDR